MNETEVKTKFYNTLYSMKGLPPDFFDQIQIEYVKLVNFPAFEITLSTTFDWTSKYKRYEKELSHYEMKDNKQIPKYVEHTYTCTTSGTRIGTYTDYFYQIPYKSCWEILNVYENQTFKIYTSDTFKVLLNESEHLSLEERFEQLKPDLKKTFDDQFRNDIEPLSKQQLPGGYEWFPEKTEFNFKTFDTALKQILTTRYIIKYFYKGKSYYWMENPNNNSIAMVDTPKIDYKTNNGWIWLLGVILLLIVWEYLEQIGNPGWGSLIVSGIYIFLINIFTSSRTAKAEENRQNELTQNIRKNQPEIFGVLEGTKEDNISINANLIQENSRLK
jgi:hypothetical protein